jgi:hypothetical protein
MRMCWSGMQNVGELFIIKTTASANIKPRVTSSFIYLSTFFFDHKDNFSTKGFGEHENFHAISSLWGFFSVVVPTFATLRDQRVTEPLLADRSSAVSLDARKGRAHVRFTETTVIIAYTHAVSHILKRHDESKGSTCWWRRTDAWSVVENCSGSGKHVRAYFWVLYNPSPWRSKRCDG